MSIGNVYKFQSIQVKLFSYTTVLNVGELYHVKCVRGKISALKFAQEITRVNKATPMYPRIFNSSLAMCMKSC